MATLSEQIGNPKIFGLNQDATPTSVTQSQTRNKLVGEVQSRILKLVALEQGIFCFINKLMHLRNLKQSARRSGVRHKGLISTKPNSKPSQRMMKRTWNHFQALAKAYR